MQPEILKRKNKIVQAGADEDLSEKLRDAAEKSLYVLAKAVMGMTAFTNHLHLPVCNWLQTCPPRKKLLLMPRSSFKTSIARCLAVHIVIQRPDRNIYFPGRTGRNLRLLFAAENEKRAVSRIGWIRRQFEQNEILRALWPECVWKAPTDAPIWTATRFSLPRDEDYPEATFESAGVDSGSTGSHYDAIFKDDLIGLRSRQEPQFMARAIEWFKTSHSLTDDVLFSLDFVFGTRWAAEDLYSWIFENEPEYEYRIYSAHNPDGTLLFPERLSEEVLAGLRKKQGDLYWLNYENKAIGTGVTAFDLSHLRECTVSGNFIEYDPTANRIYEIIEGDKAAASKEPERPKRFWELTPEERVQRWLEMQKNWYQRKLTNIEVS